MRNLEHINFLDQVFHKTHVSQREFELPQSFKRKEDPNE